MVRALVTLGALLAASAGLACPSPAADGGSLHLGSTELARPHTADAIAGGGFDLAACGDVPGAGHVAGHPAFNVYLARAEPRRDLKFRTQATCDTVLLIHTGARRWLFDDDSAGGENAAVRLRAPAEGRYDIWIGTFGPAACRARLIVETVR